MAASVSVTARVLEKMQVDARTSLPQECCGLLAGAEGIITEIFPTTNALESSSDFLIPPQELISVFRALRKRRQKLLGIYHSRPDGDNVPSPRDVETAYYPRCAYFIISPRASRNRRVRAFEILNGTVTELKIEVTG